MSHKAKSIYFAVFAVLYLGYTAFIAGHGFHWTNSIITITILALSGYYYLKHQNQSKS